MIPHPYLLVLAIPFLGAALTPLAGRFGKNARLCLVFVTGLATAVCAVSLYGVMRAGTVYQFTWVPQFLRFGLGTDGLSSFMAMIAGVLGFMVIVYSFKYMELDKAQGLSRYYALVLLFIGGMIGLVLTTNLLVLYFFWEITGLCSYALIGFDYRNPKAASAGIKAFITTRIGDVGLFAGIMALYFKTSPHTFDIPAIVQAAGDGRIPPPILAFAGFAMLAGAMAKSAQVPLHVWLPDAMEAPTPISALIHAATMVNAGVYLMTRVYPIFAGVPDWPQVVMWVGVATAFLAGIAAVVETDLKRLLAYSTMSQLGYMMFAIGTGGLIAAQYHLMSHAIFKALLFLCAGSVIHAVGSRNMRDMGGLGKKMKITAVSFFIGACALAGIPLLTNGFWSKDLILASAYHSGNRIPFLIAVLTAALTVIYSFRAFSRVFLGKPRKAAHGDHAGEAPFGMTAPVALLAFGAVFSWLLIGVYSRSLAGTGFPVEPLGLGALIKETLAPTPALAGSLTAIALGFLGLRLGAPLARLARGFFAPVVRFIRTGFGFDALYAWVGDRIILGGRALSEGYDERVADGFDHVLVRGFRGVSNGLRKTHTGDLSCDVLGIMLGLLLIIGALFFL